MQDADLRVVGQSVPIPRTQQVGRGTRRSVFLQVPRSQVARRPIPQCLLARSDASQVHGNFQLLKSELRDVRSKTSDMEFSWERRISEKAMEHANLIQTKRDGQLERMSKFEEVFISNASVPESMQIAMNELRQQVKELTLSGSLTAAQAILERLRQLETETISATGFAKVREFEARKRDLVVAFDREMQILNERCKSEMCILQKTRDRELKAMSEIIVGLEKRLESLAVKLKWVKIR
jgi:folylpolyglutamate synthase/dihydropteroate synthase